LTQVFGLDRWSEIVKLNRELTWDDLKRMGRACTKLVPEAPERGFPAAASLVEARLYTRHARCERPCRGPWVLSLSRSLALALSLSWVAGGLAGLG
jgi:hypothetical protein